MKLIASPQLPTANLIQLLDKHVAAHTKLNEIRVRNLFFILPTKIIQSILEQIILESTTTKLDSHAITGTSILYEIGR